MKLLFRSYLASLREREELDAVLPDLLSELGFTVYSRPQRGTTQAGVDIAAVGMDEDGERKLFLFSIKQGDLTRQSWDGTPQSLRPSLNEIIDTYIPTRVPRRYQHLKIVICLVFGGDMQEQVRTSISGYIAKNTTEKISFDEWNGDKLAGLMMQGILREEIMPKSVRSLFQKAVALVDEPEISYQYFSRLVYEMTVRSSLTNDRTRVRVARQLYIATWVLFVWARDVDNVEAPYQASELVVLRIWDLMRYYLNRPSSAGKALDLVLRHAIQLHLTIALGFLERKIIPYVTLRDAIGVATRSRSSVDVNLKLFDLLGRIGLTGLWLHWLAESKSDSTEREADKLKLKSLTTAGCQLIENNRALFLPIKDQHAIEIALFIMLVYAADANTQDMPGWLDQMARELAYSVRTHGRYPCIFSEYRDLVAHPRERTDEYREEATAGSFLLPLLASFLSAFGSKEAMNLLAGLVSSELRHCTLQVWLPDSKTDDGMFVGSNDHGLAVCDLPLTESGKELRQSIQQECLRTTDFGNLSAIKTGFWPLVLAACRHFRMPVPPQLWLNLVVTGPEGKIPSSR